MVVPVEAERVVAVGITAGVLIGREVVVVPVEAERVVTVAYCRSCGDRDGEVVGCQLKWRGWRRWVSPPFMWRLRWRGDGAIKAERVVVPVEMERVVVVGVTTVCVMIGGEVRWWW